MKNLIQASDTDALVDYGKAWFCCAYSGSVSAQVIRLLPIPSDHVFIRSLLTKSVSILDTCPDTKPSLLGADLLIDNFLSPSHWENCGPFL
jgi:hypothetical protein